MKKTVRVAISACMLGAVFAFGVMPALSAGTAVAATQQTAKRMTGVVTKLSTQTLTMKSEDGRTLAFSLRGADLREACGLCIGDTVDVFFTGSISGSSTKDCAVTKVFIVKQAQTVSSITGTVTDATMNTVTIKTADNRTLSFGTVDADKSKAQGLSIGDSVTINYTGTINGSSTSGVTVISLVKNAPKPVVTSQVTGTVTDATMNTVTIKTSDNRTLSFGTVDADKSKAQGLSIGDSVTVTYTGTITGSSTSGVTVVSLVKNAAKTHRISGKIVDATMNTLKIRANGRTYSFNTADAEKSAKGLKIGSWVTVYYTGDIVRTNTSGVTVTKVVQ